MYHTHTHAHTHTYAHLTHTHQHTCTHTHTHADTHTPAHMQAHTHTISSERPHTHTSPTDSPRTDRRNSFLSLPLLVEQEKGPLKARLTVKVMDAPLLEGSARNPGGRAVELAPPNAHCTVGSPYTLKRREVLYLLKSNKKGHTHLPVLQSDTQSLTQMYKYWTFVGRL